MCAQKSNKKPKNRANKIHLVFDEEKRRDFLTGFHKRKVQRQKKAKEQFEKDLKEERKRLKTEAKESYKKLVVSHRPIPELEDLLEDKYEDEDVSVKVVELSTNDIAKQNHWIGANQPTYEESSEEEEGNEDEDEEEEELPGMGLKDKKVKATKDEPETHFKSKKDVKKTLKLQATNKVKKSKVFQMKHKMNQMKQRKKSFRKQLETEKLQKKMGKGRKFKQTWGKPGKH